MSLICRRVCFSNIPYVMLAVRNKGSSPVAHKPATKIIHGWKKSNEKQTSTKAMMSQEEKLKKWYLEQNAIAEGTKVPRQRTFFTEEELDANSRQVKMWCRYNYNMNLVVRKNMRDRVETQMTALRYLRGISEDLYEKACVLDESRMPQTIPGLCDTPPIKGFAPNRGMMGYGDTETPEEKNERRLQAEEDRKKKLKLQAAAF